MKKFIKTILTSTLGLAMFAPMVFAGGFNDGSQDLPTVMVCNHTQSPCSGGPGVDGWTNSVNANAGDTISVRVYYHNTTDQVAPNVTLGLGPKTSSASTSHTFRGGVGVDGMIVAEGSASVRVNSSQTLNLISGSVRWYPNQSVSSPSNLLSSEGSLFTSSGLPVGDITPGWSSQGSVVASFKVGSTTVVIDNGGDCQVDSFTASPTSIDKGDDSTLRWNTSGDVDYVTVSNSSTHRNANGSISVNPSLTTTYTLRAYCRDGSTDTDTVRVSVRDVRENLAPQAITTVATVLGNTQARLNGIAVPNTTTESTTAWFEWGSTRSLGNKTSNQSVNLNDSSYYYNAVVSGLASGNTYYYRAAVKNQNGTAYGDIVPFQTTRTTVIPTPPTTIVRTQVQNVVVARSAPSLLELRVETNYDRMCVNGNLDYTITYRNISSQELRNTVLRFNHPKEITYISSSRGDYEVVDRTMTIDLGNVRPGEEGTITVHAKVNDSAIRGNLTVATATVVYTNSQTNAQEDAIAYSLITVSNDCPNVLGASAFGLFLPSTCLGWLLLILIILALIALGRHLYRKNDRTV